MDRQVKFIQDTTASLNFLAWQTLYTLMSAHKNLYFSLGVEFLTNISI